MLLSKWCDFSEIFEEDIKNLFDVIIRLLYLTVLHENNNRKVD
jgi:hypothetical protein